MAEKIPTRVIRMRLPVELAEALTAMGQVEIGGRLVTHREIHSMIVCSLKYAVWKHTHGSGPDVEMMPSREDRRGYGKWNDKIREPQEIAELERLFALGEPGDQQVSG
ncbi:MAG TPA: hypothetical protein VIH67_04825 [Candidatus Acidoferrum sp.]